MNRNTKLTLIHELHGDIAMNEEQIKDLREKVERYEAALKYIGGASPFTGGVDAKTVFDLAQVAKKALGIQ